MPRLQSIYTLLLFVCMLVLSQCHHVPIQKDLQGKLHTVSIDHDAYHRSFSYYLPAKRSGKHPIIFVFHSSNSCAMEIREQFGYRLDRLAEADGTVVVYPQGVQKHWNDCRKQGPYAANTEDIDDVGFVKAIIEFLGTRHDIDTDKVFATGLSNGGNFALRLALEYPNIRAVAAVGTNFPAEENFDCRHSQHPVSFLLMNGTADPINPYDGGMVSLYGLGKRGVVLSSDQTIGYWLRNANIHTVPSEKQLPSRGPKDERRSRHRQWSNGEVLVELISVKGGGHNIPGDFGWSPPFFGPRIHDYWGGDVIYDFFTRVSSTEIIKR